MMSKFMCGYLGSHRRHRVSYFQDLRDTVKSEKFCQLDHSAVFSKIMERLIYNKIFEFLVRYQILFKSQYGFTTGHNTTHATIDFLETIEQALEKDEFAIEIFCDLSKAFDTLNHDVLLEKLHHYGI